MKIGFCIDEVTPSEEVGLLPKPETVPVKSLAQVRFIGDDRSFTYYNDLFDLAPGDRVFVSGKLAGIPGVVDKVTTKFRIRLSDYEKIISRSSVELHGSFERIADKMVSYDAVSMDPEAFRTWILPPKEDDCEIICGDGYALDLTALEESEDISPLVLQRAYDYCSQGKVAYISVVHGIGTAYVNGSIWYELNFRLDRCILSEMYCDCPYPGLCKHLLAVAITLKALSDIGLNL